MQTIRGESLDGLTDDELARIQQTLLDRYKGFDRGNIVAIGFGGKKKNGRRQRKVGLSVRFYVKNKRTPRDTERRIDNEVSVRLKREDGYVLAVFATDIVETGAVKPTGTSVESRSDFSTGGMVIRGSNNEGDPLYEFWAIVTVGHAYKSESIPIQINVESVKTPSKKIEGRIIYRVRPSDKSGFDIALIEVSRALLEQEGLLDDGDQVKFPRGIGSIKNDVRINRKGKMLTARGLSNSEITITDYFPEFEIPALGKLKDVVAAIADEEVFVTGTSGATWSITDGGEKWPVAMQLAESSNGSIGYGQSYFSILVDWILEMFPDKRFSYHTIIK